MSEIHEDGYELLPDVLTKDECEQLAAFLSAGDVGRSRAGARHLFSVPVVSALARDERLVAIASAVLRQNAVPFRVTLFDKSISANWSVVWHQDTSLPLAHRFELPGWGPWSVKSGVAYAHAPTAALNRVVALRVHLDDSLQSNGPLRVLPGTHRLGVLSDENVAKISASRVPKSCVLPRGGVLAMRPLLIHSSPRQASAEPRRVLHIEYADSLHLEAGIKLATA